MVLGIIALLLSWVPIINNVAAVLAVVALGLGIPALLRARRGTHNRTGLAITGLVTSVLALVLVVVTQLIFVKVIDEVERSIDESVSEADAGSLESAAPIEDEASAPAPETVPLGVAAPVGDYEVTLDAVELDGNAIPPAGRTPSSSAWTCRRRPSRADSARSSRRSASAPTRAWTTPSASRSTSRRRSVPTGTDRRSRPVQIPLPDALHPRLVEDGLGGLVDPAVGAEDHEPVEGPGEPAVVGDGENGALERGERLLQGLGREDVEVVGRLVEQEERRAGELEQQDLEPRLLAPRHRPERLLSLVGEPVAAQRRHRPAPVDARAARLAVPEQVHGRAVVPFRMGVGLGEEPRDDARPEPPVAGVGHVLAGQQPQEVRLPRAVGTQDADPVAVPDLEVERLHQAGELQLLGHDGPYAGAPAPQQRLERQPLLLTARQRGQLAVLAPLVGDTEGGDRDGVPGHLGVVAAGVAPLGQRVGVRHLRALVVGLHERELGRLDGVPGLPDRRR